MAGVDPIGADSSGFGQPPPRLDDCHINSPRFASCHGFLLGLRTWSRAMGGSEDQAARPCTSVCDTRSRLDTSPGEKRQNCAIVSFPGLEHRCRAGSTVPCSALAVTRACAGILLVDSHGDSRVSSDPAESSPFSPRFAIGPADYPSFEASSQRAPGRLESYAPRKESFAREPLGRDCRRIITRQVVTPARSCSAYNAEHA